MKKQPSKSRRSKIWQLQEAKAEFSCVIESAVKNGYQTITKRGEPVAVILSKKEFDRLTKPRTSLLNLFRFAPYPELELSCIRQKDMPREIDL